MNNDSNQMTLSQLLLTICFFVCIWYFFFDPNNIIPKTELSNFPHLNWWSWLVLGAVILITVAFFEIAISELMSGWDFPTFIFSVFFGVFTIPLFLIILSAPIGLFIMFLDGVRILISKLENGGITLSISFIAILLSIISFLFRLKFRFTYGFIEVVVGVAVIFSKTERPVRNLSEIINPDFLLLILTAGIFLIVRGIDNMYTDYPNIRDSKSFRLVVNTLTKILTKPF